MDTVEYEELYALQDKVLAGIFAKETTFYLTGGTCLHRFYVHRRFSADLDLFTNDNSLFRDDARMVRESLTSSGIPFEVQVDTRDFVRLLIESSLRVDLVNDRVYRFGKSVRSPSGVIVDNLENLCANKICAILGRDDPKDVFDLGMIVQESDIKLSSVISGVEKKCVLDPEVLEFRLSSFPLRLLNDLAVTDQTYLKQLKGKYNDLVQELLQNIQ